MKVDARQFELQTDDFDVAVAKLNNEYSPHRLSILDNHRAFKARYRADGFNGITIQTLGYGANVRAETQPFSDYLLLSQVNRGRYRISSSEGERLLLPGDIVTLDPNTAYSMEFFDDCEMTQLRISAHTWSRSVVEIIGCEDLRPLQFAITAPLDCSFENRCRALLRLVANDGATRNEWTNSEILRHQIENLCVAALLDTPTRQELKPLTHAMPSLIKRALDYFDENCQESLTIVDIARALKVSPRGLQNAFQKELGMTPMMALRDVRLRRAFEDLKKMSPGQTTITEIALQWGFGNLGRFAQDFRERFGKSPNQVFRS